MGLLGALNSAVSALAAQSQALSTVSDNLANASTYGYKADATTFEALVSGNSSSADVGGVIASQRADVTAQGTLTSTDTNTDLAISGSGFFAVRESTSSNSETLYTRDGEFSIDKNGYLEENGYYLLGWATDSSGDVTSEAESALTAINTESVKTDAAATTTMSLSANLPADASVGTTYTSSMEVYDSLGTASEIEITWDKTAENTWTASFANPTSTSDSSTSVGTLSGSPITLNFNSDGSLASTSPSPATLSITGWTTGAADSSITLNLGAGGTSGITQDSTGSSSSAVDLKVTQDGVAYGTLDGVTIGTDGAVVASYSNGEQRTIYKVAVATFANADGLEAQSDGMYAETEDSGTSTFSLSSADGAGTVEAGELEESTTDTSKEFSTMMAAQQAYSAAAQVMSTVNSMFQTLIQDVR